MPEHRIKWLTENAEKYLSDETMTLEKGLEEKISYEPLGVICNISAWNYPYLVGVNVFVPALLAGNAVMYKPSEYATLTGLEIEKLLNRQVFPKIFFMWLSVQKKWENYYWNFLLMDISLPALIKPENTFMKK